MSGVFLVRREDNRHPTTTEAVLLSLAARRPRLAAHELAREFRRAAAYGLSDGGVRYALLRLRRRGWIRADDERRHIITPRGLRRLWRLRAALGHGAPA
jgi:repressor of nif and glnA expression